MYTHLYACIDAHTPFKSLTTLDDQVVDLEFVLESEMHNAPKIYVA